jgi:hypothetical protein
MSVMVRYCLLGIYLSLNVLPLWASDRRVQSAPQPPLAHGGEFYSGLGEVQSDSWPQPCVNHGHRSCVHRHQGLGFDILDSESEAFFVPDEEFQLLDSLVDQVEKQVQINSGLRGVQSHNQAMVVSKAISDALELNGFGLCIPTDTLSDALLNRNLSSDAPRLILDCDSGSFVFLTITEALKAPVSLVDITLPSGAGHNYVQWKLDCSNSMN